MKNQQSNAQEFENSDEQRKLRTLKLDAETSKILADYNITYQQYLDYKNKGIVPEGMDGRLLSVINRLIENLRR